MFAKNCTDDKHLPKPETAAGSPNGCYADGDKCGRWRDCLRSPGQGRVRRPGAHRARGLKAKAPAKRVTVEDGD